MRPEICSPNGHAGRKSAVVFLCISFARQRRNSDWKDWFAHRARRFRDATWWDQSQSSNVEAKRSRHPSVESNVLARENYEPYMWRIACSLPLRGKHPFVGILDEMSDRRCITTRGMSKFWVLRYTKDATYARVHIEIVRVRIEIRFGVPCQGLKCELKTMNRSIPSGTFSDSFDALMTGVPGWNLHCVMAFISALAQDEFSPYRTKRVALSGTQRYCVSHRHTEQKRERKRRRAWRGKISVYIDIIKNVDRPDIMIIAILNLANMGVCRRQALRSVHPFFYEWQGWALLTLISILGGLMLFFYIYVYVRRSAAVGERLGARITFPQKCVPCVPSCSVG